VSHVVIRHVEITLPISPGPHICVHAAPTMKKGGRRGGRGTRGGRGGRRGRGGRERGEGGEHRLHERNCCLMS